MALTRLEFDTLHACYKVEHFETSAGLSTCHQRYSEYAPVVDIERCKHIGSLHKDLCISQGYLQEIKPSSLDGFTLRLTERGRAALDQYRVHNAIILGAGFASRFAPASYVKPKGVISVKGEVLIERQIKQLKAAGISQIVLVVGYKKEEFYYLKTLFADLEIIVNPHFDQMNSIESLRCARPYALNSYICPSDHYFVTNPFERYEYEPFYSLEMAAESSSEYTVLTTESGQIIPDRNGEASTCNVSSSQKDVFADNTPSGQTESNQPYIMRGHVYADQLFFTRYFDLLDKSWGQPGVDQMVWEDLYLAHTDTLCMKAHFVPPDTVYEFNSIDDIKRFDPDYLKSYFPRLCDNICSTLQCEPHEISAFNPLVVGLSNRSFSFTVHGEKFVYRHPGEGSDRFVDRLREHQANTIAYQRGLDPTLVKLDPVEGWKITRFVQGRPLNPESTDDLDLLFSRLAAIKKNAPTQVAHMDFWEMGNDLTISCWNAGRLTSPAFQDLRERANALHIQLKHEDYPLVLCHHDLYPPNVLVNDDDKTMAIIDWEFAGMNDPAFEFGSLVVNLGYNHAQALWLLQTYFLENSLSGLTLEEDKTATFDGEKASQDDILILAHWIATVGLIAFYWICWTVFKDIVGFPISKDLELSYHKYAHEFIDYAMGLYQRVDNECVTDAVRKNLMR